ATLIAVPMIALTYILPTAAGLASIGNWENWKEGIGEETVGYGTVLTQFLGNEVWGIVFGVVAVLSACSIYNTWMTAGTRVLFSMSEDNLGPKFVTKINKHGVPYVPVLIMAITNLILCSFEFTVVLVIEVLLIIGTQVLLFITMIVMRYKKPEMERPIKIPGNKIFINAFFTIPIVIGLIAYLLNGTDYFIGGLVGLATGPFAYLFFKKRYGGLAKLDSEKYPVNKKTGLAVGDMYRMARLFFVLTFLAVLGGLFLPWYEGQWGPEYYLETYGVDIFDFMIKGLWVIAGVSIIGALICLMRGKKVE
ncbi:MAG: amino acid permease, partial [Anaerovoracaceae bacterium]